MSASKEVGELQFRPLTEDDLAFLLSVRNECHKFLHDERRFTLEEAVAWFWKNKPEYWLILLGGARIGYFRMTDRCDQHRRAVVGADLHKDFRGQGLGHTAWCKFLEFVFTSLDLHKVSLEVLATNERAISLYRKLGFQLDGVKRQDIYRDGRWIDSFIMSVLRSEWRNRLAGEDARFSITDGG